MADVRASTISFSPSQVAAVVALCIASVSWAVKVDSQLADIQKSLGTIETSIKEIKTSDTAQDKLIDQIRNTCCRKTAEASPHWLPVMPAILPDDRRRTLGLQGAVATGGNI